MNPAFAGVAMLAGVAIATRRPTWNARKPMSHAERKKVESKCGSRCFAGPNRGYPMCAKNARVCGTDCDGARAAFSRARQQKKPKIALKAARAGKRADCSWVRGKAAQSVLKGYI